MMGVSKDLLLFIDSEDREKKTYDNTLKKISPQDMI
jgi:hypothetical protein